MRKKILWKDIWQALRKSKGRFFSIAGLMALGSFALVGLKVAGPDMRATGTDYFRTLNVADITVIGDYGISATDEKQLNAIKGAEKVEYGYLKDVTIRDQEASVRLFSKPKAISKYQVKAGRMPKAASEIVLDASYDGKYKLDDTIDFAEKAGVNGGKVLRRTRFTIVGFVYSGEILSEVNRGPSTAGSGELKGYGVVMSSVFDSDVYMLAHLRFTDLIKLDPYSTTYRDRVQAHKKTVENALKDAPKERLDELKTTANATIDKNQKKLTDAEKKLTDTENQLKDARAQLDVGQAEITANEAAMATKVAEANAQIQTGAAQLATAEASLASAKQQLAEAQTQLAIGQRELISKRAELANAQTKLAAAQTQLNTANAQLTAAKQQLTTGQQTIAAKETELATSKGQLTAANKQYTDGIAQLNGAIAGLQQQLTQPGLTPQQTAQLQQQLAGAQAKLAATQRDYAKFQQDTYTPGMAKITAGETQLAAAKADLATKQQQYNAGMQTYQAKLQTYNTSAAEIQNGQAALDAGANTLASKQGLYNTKLTAYNAGMAQFNQKKQELATAQTALNTQKQDGEAQLAAAKATIAQKEAEYQEKAAEFAKAAPKARKEIEDGKVALEKAKDKVAKLKTPTYSAYNRREMVGGEGYKTYTTISQIIDSLANVFPIFLYFVAALVTFTTMARFVDEERINSGTLRALGYDRKDVIRKFTFYGFLASMLGTIVGIIAGHILLPMIVYNAYSAGFTLPPIQLIFRPWVTLISIGLGLLSAVLPAYLSAKGELADQAAELLLPKPPAAGSKIFLERIKFVWNHMSFTHKVTARNIFRYKKRMLMTIFGVAGAVSLLFTGWSVRGSIGEMAATQFGEIIHYDMIVAKNSDLTKTQAKDYDDLLNSAAVKRHTAVHYEALSKVAGANGDSQEITLVVPQTTKDFAQYIETRDRKTQQPLVLPDTGAIISERFATLTGAKIGDTMTITDARDHKQRIKVAGITEMYMGHFVVMSRQAYEQAFKTTYKTNGNLINLKDNRTANVEKEAAKFMNLAATAGVVQNTTLTNQIDTIVKSLDKIMLVLIVVAGMLAVVIMYNLTNINVSERIRELSTIKVLGFFNKEVTLYIYRETILLTGIGILVGFGIGDALFRYILAVVPPDSVMFNPSVVGTSFLWPTVLIAIVTAVLGWVVNRTLKQVDMLEALSSVD